MKYTVSRAELQQSANPHSLSVAGIVDRVLLESMCTRPVAHRDCSSYLLKEQKPVSPQMQILDNPVLRKFLSEHSNHTKHPPLAVFDCDGTIIRGDIGEAMLYRQIEHFCFRVSPGDIWTDHPYRDELDRLHRALSSPGDQHRTRPEFDRFAHLILSWYFGQIAEGKVAKACADIVRLFAGYTPEEVRGIARETFDDERHAPLSQRQLGGYTRPSGVRYFRESLDVLRALQGAGFDIVVVSGSNRWSVESVFGPLGVPRTQIVGIDLRADGHTYSADVLLPIPVQEDKIAALTSVDQRTPALVASDSRNDIPLLLHTSDLKLYVNSRRKSSAEFFELAGISPDESWVIIERPTPEE